MSCRRVYLRRSSEEIDHSNLRCRRGRRLRYFDDYFVKGFPFILYDSNCQLLAVTIFKYLYPSCFFLFLFFQGCGYRVGGWAFAFWRLLFYIHMQREKS